MSDFNWHDYPTTDHPGESGFKWDDHPIVEQPQGFLEKTGRAVVNELPTIGGIAGGIIGTPADVIAGPVGNVAGIGGYLGTAAKNAINHYIAPEQAPQTMSQALLDPVTGGVRQAGYQAGGELIGRGLGAVANKVSGPVADYLKALAERRAIAATRVPGNQVFNKFSEDAGRQLLDRGIVGLGDSQSSIAKNAQAALDQSGKEIGDSLKALDAQGGKVSRTDLVASLNEAASQMKDNPALAGARRQLSTLIEDISEGPEQYTLSEAEKVKRDFQNNVNWLAPENNPSQVAASDAYRRNVEKNAIGLNPDLAGKFTKAKEDFGLLAPISEATSKKAAVLNNLNPIGLGDYISGGAGAVLGAGSGHSLPYAAAGALANKALNTYGNSTAAVGADFLSNLVRTSPQSLGKWAPALTQAAARGGQSLPATDYVLQQTDPEYAKHLDNLKKSQEDLNKE
jgi:hypothetical protein